MSLLSWVRSLFVGWDDWYVVKKGDTLSGIAAKFPESVTWQKIYEANRDVIGSNPNRIKPGQTLRIPGGSNY